VVIARGIFLGETIANGVSYTVQENLLFGTASAAHSSNKGTKLLVQNEWGF